MSEWQLWVGEERQPDRHIGNRVLKSCPSTSRPWDLNVEIILTVVNEKGQIIF